MWNFICWVILGAIVGCIANKIMKNTDTSFIQNVILGVVGSLFGGWVGSLIGFTASSAFSIKGCFIAIVGACIIIAIVRMVKK